MTTTQRFLWLVLLLVFTSNKLYSQPLALHPDNPHYFIYKGQPTVLITSAEHYGSVINLDFDFERYLKTLHDLGFNHTRIFLGDYIESPGAFCIETNTLCPKPDRFITPWMRSRTAGYKLGGNKFDLDRWNPDYFKRLHRFMTLAERYEIVVEAPLFFVGYLFENSPFHPDNNINNTSSITNAQYMTLSNGNILKYQEAYCRRLVRELNAYDNLIINVANEPWFGNQEFQGFSSPPPLQTKVWIQRVSEWIVDEEKNLPKQHLVALDYTNQGHLIPEEELSSYFKHISVFNHHYDHDAESLYLNYDRVDRVLSFNETGLMPPVSSEYRKQGWKYLMSGGALYNNLDFTYQVGAEDGSGHTAFTCEGVAYTACCDPDMKYQLANLLKFMNSIPFVGMKPDRQVIDLQYGDEQVFPLVAPDQFYAVYFIGGEQAHIKLKAKPGVYKISWINPSDLKVLEEKEINNTEESLNLLGPKYSEDIVLKVERR